MENTYRKTSLRAFSLDALRGYAILTMVLSGTIVSSVLPGWMSHAQVPPPHHQFDPSIFGITWVDLVFPFFLFAMGAAFPFSIGSKLNRGVSVWKVSLDSIFRGLKLTFFAIFIQHMYPWILSNPQDYRAWLITLSAFLLMFPMFMRMPWKMPNWLRYFIQIAAYGIAIVMLLTVQYANDRVFSFDFSNIIILVLANMAIFGSLAYIFTYKNKWLRIGILPFVMAVFLAGTTNPESWTGWLYNYSPIPWLYKFYYLKYLFIVIPGSIAGEYLQSWMNNSTHVIVGNDKKEKQMAYILLIVTALLIVFNLYGLYTRQLVLNLIVTIVLLLIGYFSFFKQKTNTIDLWRNLFLAGAYLLMLGLFFEAYEGGIRKDQSTYSYYFVASGLAFMALIFFSVVCDYFQCKKSTSFLVMSGQNPMIAYVGSSMVIMPLLNILHITPLLDCFSENPWLGFLRGVIITGLVTALAMFFTRIKWFWRT